MDWQALAALAQVAAVVAVIPSLIYLAVQVRTGAKVFRTDYRDAAFRSLMDWNYHLVADPDLAWMFHRGCRDFESLNEKERSRMLHLFYSFFKVMENQHLHFLEGVLDAEVWNRSRATLAQYAVLPGARYYIGMRQQSFHPRFRDLLNEMRDSELKASDVVAAGSGPAPSPKSPRRRTAVARGGA
jgi:hypothetical protein